MGLTATEREMAFRTFLRREAPPNITKPDLRTAVDAVDAWLDDNAASFNQALPDSFKTTATTQQKYLLLLYVLLKRMGKV